MSLVQKIHNAVSAHPCVVTTVAVFGIGLAITAIVGSVTGMIDNNHIAQAIAGDTNNGG
jgi:glutamate/tyrosine decarboxylase-like PLP-dependent enzyme